MIRRLVNVAAIAFGLLALLGLFAIVASYVRPTTCVVEKVEWDLHEIVRTYSTFVGIADGRIVYFADPRPAGRETLKQDDWTLSQLGVNPAEVSHTVAVPVDGQPRAMRYATVVGSSSSSTSASLAWPIVLGGAAFVVARVAASRSTTPTGARRCAWGTRLLALASGAAGLLLVAAVVLCARSYPYFERIDLAVPLVPGPEAIQVNSSRGSMMFAWTSAGPKRTLAGGGIAYVRSTIPVDRGPLYKAAELKGDFEQALGFTLGFDGGSALPRNVLIAPYWSAFVLLAATTFGFAQLARRRRNRDRRASEPLCHKCAYDCRGLADRCPECGTPIAAG